jgi:crotonobetainyl-CoA:carnitine CoA-transferase CaiB-like acyl-CoA transferase
MPGQMLYDDASTHAALVVEAALAQRDTIPAQTIDIAAHNLGSWQHLTITRYGQIGRIIDRATNFGPPPGGVWQCRNGLVDIAAHALHHWDIFVELIGSPEELTDEMYKDRGIRVQLFDMLTTMVEEHMREQDAQEFVERAQAAGLPCAMMYRPDEFLHDIQPQARGTFVQVDHPLLGEITIPGPSVHSSVPLVEYRRPSPALGQANVEVYVDELGYSAATLEDWSSRGLV